MSPPRSDRRGIADRLLIALLLVAAVGIVAISVRTLAGDGLVSSYVAPLYWMDYRAGFVRRGLPGELLSLVSNGPPSCAVVTRSSSVATSSRSRWPRPCGWAVDRPGGRPQWPPSCSYRAQWSPS